MTSRPEFAPLFLVGAPRSGTTLLWLMLDHHPDITWAGEFNYAVDLVDSQGNWPELPAYYTWLETDFVFQRTGLTIDRNLTYPQLMESFLRQKQSQTGKKFVGATVHRHFDRLLYLWPRARFIHLIRDGRDVTRSCIGLGWAGNVYTGLTIWLKAEQLWTKVQPGLAPGQHLEVKYEDLIQQPETQLKRLCSFIGLAYDPHMLAYPADTTYSPPDRQLVEQWRHRLTNFEIGLIEAQIGFLLVERGYELSGLSSCHIPFWRKVWLRLHDRRVRLHFRLRRYGLGLWLLDALSRRLGLTALQKQAAQKINVRKTPNLK